MRREHILRVLYAVVFVVLTAAVNLQCGDELPVDSLEQLEAEFGGTLNFAEFLASQDLNTVTDRLQSYNIRYYRNPDEELHGCATMFSSDFHASWSFLNGEYYYVDYAGRPSRAYTFLPPIEAERRASRCQRDVGRWGDEANPDNDYDGGHMIGSQLGGWGARANLVPQDLNFNRGNWVKLENKLATCKHLDDGQLFYAIRVYYPDEVSLIPHKMEMYIEDKVSQRNVRMIFDNIDEGGSQGDEQSARGVDFLTSLGCER